MNVSFVVSIFEFVLALVALILVHEFGHFLVSRLLHVEVEEFGIGFPPRITKLFRAWGTDFTLNALPLGGFVRPKGENDPSIEGGLAAASPWVRLAVLFAGPFMNLLVGVILFAIIFSRTGIPDQTRVQVIDVAQGSPAAAAGLKAGDFIIRINNQQINSTTLLQQAIAASLDKPTALYYERNGQVTQVTLTPRSKPPQGQGAIGIVMGNPTVAVNPLQAIPAGTQAVYSFGRALLALPVQMIRGTALPDSVRFVGFKGMFDIYEQARTSEPTPGTPAGVNLLFFFANITISLGLINLVPFPALDGGRILFTLPEIILRRRIPTQYENLINLVGFGLLILLMLYVNLQDFISPAILPK
jgi:regulator of sigma E protease